MGLALCGPGLLASASQDGTVCVSGCEAVLCDELFCDVVMKFRDVCSHHMRPHSFRPCEDLRPSEMVSIAVEIVIGS